MISTITTSTVSTITTSALAGSIGGIAILILCVLLLQRELITSAKGRGLERLRKALNIGIMPLFLTFIVLSIIKIAEIIR